jgi:hypothetical protein
VNDQLGPAAGRAAAPLVLIILAPTLAWIAGRPLMRASTAWPSSSFVDAQK